MQYLQSIFSEYYQGLEALYLGLIVGASFLILFLFAKVIPVFKSSQQLNKETGEQRLTKDYYRKTQNKSKLWGGVAHITGFLLVFPFCIATEAQAWWEIALDVFIILMFYDFFYYLTHRFLFHDGPLGGPLLHIHAVHHRYKNPCRKDSNYLHPLETVIGIGLFLVSIIVLTLLIGKFSLITLWLTNVAFIAINTHNHDLIEEKPGFPFRYWHHAAHMHHIHHSRFTSGNYATISLFYDWLFGTYDTGNGYGKNKETRK